MAATLRRRSRTAMPLQDSQSIVLVLLALACALLGGVAWLVWTLIAHARRSERLLGNLTRLEELQTALGKLSFGGEQLDLRRLEHVLIDIRDNQKRLEERLLTLALQRGAATHDTPALVAGGDQQAAGLAERVVTRLLSLGYERVQLVTTLAEIELLLGSDARDGEIIVEARRDGAACKGKVLVRGGMIRDLQIQSAYSTFP
jgi:hypothetical protein